MRMQTAGGSRDNAAEPAPTKKRTKTHKPERQDREQGRCRKRRACTAHLSPKLGGAHGEAQGPGAQASRPDRQEHIRREQGSSHGGDGHKQRQRAGDSFLDSGARVQAQLWGGEWPGSRARTSYALRGAAGAGGGGLRSFQTALAISVNCNLTDGYKSGSLLLIHTGTSSTATLNQPRLARRAEGFQPTVPRGTAGRPGV